MNEQSGVGELKGIGEKTEKLFQKLGVFTVGDLIRFRTQDHHRRVCRRPGKAGEILSPFPSFLTERLRRDLKADEPPLYYRRV